MNSATILFVGIVLLARIGDAADFYVSPNGSDTNSGSKESPFVTLEAARDAARKTETGSNNIILLPGDYFLTNTFVLDARDNGLTIEAAKTGTATLYGGRIVTHWRRDGERFWCADLPGVKEGAWDFGALVVNDRMADRARMPAAGSFHFLNKFDVPWLSTVAGGWARPPTQAELTMLRYGPRDIPTTLEVHNAEVRVYHLWDESLVGVVSNDIAHHVLILQKGPEPLGAFGINKYVIFNTREGMTRPGQWYLDRVVGRVVYWPLPGEDLSHTKIIAPVLGSIISIAGTSNAPVERVTICGVTLEATTTPLLPPGFGAEGCDGAVSIEHARQCVLENLEIANTGGDGILALALANCQIRNCSIHNTAGCAISATGLQTLIAYNHLDHVGLIYPSAIALSAFNPSSAEGKGFHIYRNEIHDASYSGIGCSGGGFLIEQNLIYRVMLDLNDGAAIYGQLHNSILRGNMVRDVNGYKAWAYYLDEGSRDCAIEHNVSVDVEGPVLDHIARNVILRDNVFIARKNMMLAFPRSKGCVFRDNTLLVPAKLEVDHPRALDVWTNNTLFSGGTDKTGTTEPFEISNGTPLVPPPERRRAPIEVIRVSRPPNLDGEIRLGEWPGGLVSVDRDSSREQAGGPPAYAYFTYDDQYLYVGVNVPLFDILHLRKGTIWDKDDGVEICIPGKRGTFVVRGFVNGQIQSVGEAGAPAEAAAKLARVVRFVAESYDDTKGDRKCGWQCEWAIPLDAFGIKPVPGQKVDFNLVVYRAENGIQCFLEGTYAAAWRLRDAAVLQFK